MLGPFSIDTYLPAFADIAASLGATPLQMQQTLSAYLFGFAFMALFHGAISDSYGRRPVVLWGLAVFTAASVGCAMSHPSSAPILFAALDFSWSSPVVAFQSFSSSSASAFARSLMYGAAMASISYSSVVSTRFDESE